MKKRFFLFFFCATSLLHSQTKIDSLHTELNRSTQDTTKIKILHQLHDLYKSDSVVKADQLILKSIELSQKAKNTVWEVKSYTKYAQFLRQRIKIDSAISTYLKSIELAEKVNFSEGISDAYNSLGYIYLRMGNFDKALDYHQKNLAIALKMKNDGRAGNAYGGIGGVYSERGEYTKAMENYVLSSKKHQKIGNLKDHAINLANIGMLQDKLGNYKSAAQYLKQSDSIAKITNQPQTSTYVWYVLGRLYNKTGELDKALKYSKKALDSYEKNGQKNQAGFTSYTLGTIYWKQRKYNKALNAFQKRMEIAVEAKDSVSISQAYKAMGDCYQELDEPEKAKSSYINALNIAKLHNNALGEIRILRTLSRFYAAKGDYKSAYKSKNRYIVLKDSLYTIEKRDLATKIEAEYQNEQKTKEIALLESEKKLQALQINKRENERNGIILLSLAILILAALIYNQYRIKQKSNKKLQELDKLKSNFFANISHEFRTPLTLIKGPIEHLEQNFDEKLSLENVKMIRRNTNRVLTLVNQLLDLSKIDSGNLSLHLTEGDIYKCLRAATTSFSSHAAQRNIDYRIQIPSAVLWTSFDRDKLEKVVYNLLSNAFKFSEDNSVVSCTIKHNEGNLQIQVSDSGSGIPEESLPFIFDRFYQADSSNTKEKKGSGIGLSLSKDLVELMDGTITVSSEISKGTFFTVQLPIQEIKTGNKKSTVAQKYNTESPKEKEPLQIPFPDKRNLPVVLLVDDNKDMRHFITEILLHKYRVNQAANGKEGLSKAFDNSPDLIVTDLMMPKMDGLEFCAKLKTDVNTSHIPVIMLTAKAGIENKIEGLETGADDYLTKPFETKELLVRAKNLIEQRKNLRELYSNKHIHIDPKKITVTSIDQKFLEKIISLLEDNYKDPEFNIQQMQEVLAMSKSQLHRKLKALTNEAPGELLRNFRLKRAAQLLAHKVDNVTQIAYQVGFNNLSYFAKCFKEFYGVSPSTFNKQ